MAGHYLGITALVIGVGSCTRPLPPEPESSILAESPAASAVPIIAPDRTVPGEARQVDEPAPSGGAPPVPGSATPTEDVRREVGGEPREH